MRIKRHHSQTTRDLHAALQALARADRCLQEARDLLVSAVGGQVPEPLGEATLSAIVALNCGRDGDGKPDLDGRNALEHLEDALKASAEQDDADLRDAHA